MKNNVLEFPDIKKADCADEVARRELIIFIHELDLKDSLDKEIVDELWNVVFQNTPIFT